MCYFDVLIYHVRLTRSHIRILQTYQMSYHPEILYLPKEKAKLLFVIVQN